jgi:hypothetical protein
MGVDRTSFVHDEVQALRAELIDFCPHKIFSFFMWGEIRAVSPHAARASRLRLTD